MPIDTSTLPSTPATGNQHDEPLLGANELEGGLGLHKPRRNGVLDLGRQGGGVLADHEIGGVNEGLGRQSCWQRLIASITSIVRRFTQAIGL